MSVAVKAGPAATVEAEHRDGFCEVCEIHMEKTYEDVPDQEEQRWWLQCPKCNGRTGRLVARSVSIQPPPQPSCTKPKCLWQFFLDTLYSSLLSNYHCRRVRYAEEKRHKKIPMKYRTGEDAPQNIKRAILAIIILRLRR